MTFAPRLTWRAALVCRRDSPTIHSGLRFVHLLIYPLVMLHLRPVDAFEDRNLIRYRMRALEKEGRSVTAVLRQLEKALAERERHAA